MNEFFENLIICGLALACSVPLLLYMVSVVQLTVNS